MITKEIKVFNLKEERKKLLEMFVGTPHISQIYRIVLKQDKEFIKLLKESCSTFQSAGAICSVIDKLVRDKLK